MYSLIVVPLDGSEESDRALPHAEALAKAFGATLHLLQAVSHAEAVEMIRGSGENISAAEYSRDVAQDLINARLKRADEHLKSAASRLQSQGIKAETVVLEGSARENIVEYASQKNADLIVMCTRGQGGIQRLLLGSTTDRVIRSGNVPVLAIPPQD